MFYWAAVILTALAFTITVFILRSRFGLFLQAIRGETRTRLIERSIDCSLLRRSHNHKMLPGCSRYAAIGSRWADAIGFLQANDDPRFIKGLLCREIERQPVRT